MKTFATFALVVAPVAVLAAGPTPPPEDFELAPDVRTNGANAVGVYKNEFGVLWTREDGGATIWDNDGNHVMDCDENLKDCLSFMNDGTTGGGTEDGGENGGTTDTGGGTETGGKKKKKKNKT